MSSDLSSASIRTSEPSPEGLGLVTLVAIVVANMIGVGLFTSSGYSLAALGSPGRVMFAWVLCGIWAICGAIAYGGLVSRLPQSGGEYLFLSRFVHPSVGFLAGWISLIAGFTAPIALAAKSAAVHMVVGSQSQDLWISLLAAGLICLATALHVAGIRVGTGAQNGIVIGKLMLMLFVGLSAFLWHAGQDWKGGPLPGRSISWWPESGAAWWTLAGSMSWIALSYTGFNAAIYVAGESKHARRLVPWSMIVGTLVVAAIYLVLNYIFVYFPEPESIVGQEQVAAIAARALGGNRLDLVVRVIIVLSSLSSVFAMLMLGPRVYRQMAVDKVFPSLFVDASYRKTTILQGLLSVVVCFAANLVDLMSYLGLTLSACGALAVGSLLWVRKSIPETARLSVVEKIAISVYLAMSLLLIVASCPQRPNQFWAMVGTFILGVLVFLAWRFKSKP